MNPRGYLLIVESTIVFLSILELEFKRMSLYPLSNLLWMKTAIVWLLAPIHRDGSAPSILLSEWNLYYWLKVFGDSFSMPTLSETLTVWSGIRRQMCVHAHIIAIFIVILSMTYFSKPFYWSVNIQFSRNGNNLHAQWQTIRTVYIYYILMMSSIGYSLYRLKNICTGVLKAQSRP